MQLTDRRAIPEAPAAPKRLSFKDAESASGQLLALDDAEGIVTAIVSVTGTEDEVADIIVPGAYAATLVKRRPKVCWAHSWEHPIGRVLYIEELLPGDERLPTQQKDGSPWDPRAGALVATMQFNMRTTEGKDAFEAVRFYSETGECEYSIGYQVPAGQSTRDSKGVRHIKSLELYELSVVLFGAHTMTGTLSIKAALAAALERKSSHETGTLSRGRRSAKDVLAAARAAKIEGKAMEGAIPGAAPTPPPAAPPGPAVPPTADEPDPFAPVDTTDQPDHSDGVMVALYPDPAAKDAIASAISGPDNTTPPDELHVTLAYLGKMSEVSMTADEIFRRVSDAVEGEPGLSGSIGGIGMFPPSEGSEDRQVTWVPVDVPGLTMLREQIAEALGDVVATDHGFTPHMTLGYDLGMIDPLPSIPVSFGEVRVVFGTATRDVPLGPVVDPDAEADGFPFQQKDDGADLDGLSLSDVMRLTAMESLREGLDGKAAGVLGFLSVKAEGGADRNRGGAEKLRRYWTTGAGGAKIAWGTPGDFTRCARLLSEHMTPERAKGYCANRHKEMTGMWPGDKDNKSYDPALEAKDTPVPSAKGGYPRLTGSWEERQDALLGAVTEALRGDEEEEGRWEWPGVCIDGTFEDTDRPGTGYLIASRYKYDGTDTRETYEMDWEVTPIGVDLGEPQPRELQVVALGVEGDDVDEVSLGDVIPFAENIMDVAHAFKAVTAGVEVKAGRVLSGQNERRIREATETLVSVLAAAGVRISVQEHEEEDDGKPDSTTDPEKSDVRQPVDPMVDTSTTSPSASTKGLAEVIETKGDSVVLDAAAVQSRLAQWAAEAAIEEA